MSAHPFARTPASSDEWPCARPPTGTDRLDLAGVKDPLAAERDGISFAPVLRGEPDVLDDPESHRVAILVEKPVRRSWSGLVQHLSASPLGGKLHGAKSELES